MATKPLLDFEALLAPIPGSNPAGESLRYAGDFDEIKKLLPKPDRDAFEASGQEGQWPDIQRESSRRLREKSKDLQLAAWLAEALVHLQGFAGLRDGLTLIERLLTQYWDTLYPLADDGDLEVRAAPLLAMLERNAGIWVCEIPLTRSPARDQQSDQSLPVTYNLWHSIVVAKLPEQKMFAPAMEAAVGASSNEYYLALHADLREGLAALESLNRVLDERFGGAAPGVTAAREAFLNCEGRIASILRARGVSTTATTGATDTPTNDQSTGPEEASLVGASARRNGSSGSGPVRSRDEALQRLREVADFFRQTEPHSPVPYLIQRAITWSQMSFDQLLAELVQDATSRQQINSTLGIREDVAASAYSNGEENA
ncbi:MAG: type VI secretion system protein TssA [Pirellulaceae bacterium]